MLTVLDADIDISALLDGAEDQPPAITAANDAVVMLEGAATLAGTSTADESLHAGDARDFAKEETLEEKRHRMSDLLTRLGLNAEARQKHFRVFAHSLYGRGWAQRPEHVDAMNARLATALDDRSRRHSRCASASRRVV